MKIKEYLFLYCFDYVFTKFLKRATDGHRILESHFSYAEGRLLATGNGTIFCAAALACLFSVKNDVLEVIDKNKGLSESVFQH